MRIERGGISTFSSTEIIWGSLVVTLTVWSLLAVGLATVNLFKGWILLIAGVLACGVGWGVRGALKSLERPTSRRELILLAMLLGVGLLLFCWPAELFPMLGDAPIYPNTAVLLARHGGLTYHYGPLDGLTQRQKQLFYIPADRQLSNIEIQSYQGLLYGAYYVMNLDHNTIVSSRPPLLSTWMGAFDMVGGKRGMLYVTPIFGTLSLIMVYFLGKRVFNADTGAMAALWLLLSFPQLHFSRTSYAEVMGQFFVLGTLYGLVTYLQTHHWIYIVTAVAALTAAFSARLEAIFLLPTLGLFIIFLLFRRDWRGGGISVTALLAASGFTLWTVNQPYVGATGELLWVGQLKFLRFLDSAAWLGLLLGMVFLAVLAVLLVHRHKDSVLRRIRWGLAGVVMLGVGYLLYVRPLFPEYMFRNGIAFPTYNEEIMVVMAQYMSPPFFWMVALGGALVTLVVWRKNIRWGQALFLLATMSFGIFSFWKYTSTRLYPVALRRMVPTILPTFALLAAFAVCWLGHRRRWHWSGLAIAGLIAALLIGLSGPYWFYRQAPGTGDFIAEMAERLPSDAIILFEPQHEDVIVGWFASPLWSFYQRNALLLSEDSLDGETLDEVIRFWRDSGREIYIVAQRDPADWWPGEFPGQLKDKTVWNSSIIGQSRLFPPLIWSFAFTFFIYRL